MTERETTQEAHRLLTAYDAQHREAAELTGTQVLSLPSTRHRTLAVLAV